jgi:hypothetical protein
MTWGFPPMALLKTPRCNRYFNGFSEELVGRKKSVCEISLVVTTI